MVLLTGDLDKFHIGQQQGGQLTTVNGTGVDADFVVFHQGCPKDRMSENNGFAEIV